jgi:ribonucleoside-diphosphate reductase alpha chain
MREDGKIRRASLPNRRPHELVRFECQGHVFIGGIGRYGNGSIAELFLNASKAGSPLEAMAQDAAIVASLALQFGCPVDVLRHAIARSGDSAGPLAALLDEVVKG